MLAKTNMLDRAMPLQLFSTSPRVLKPHRAMSVRAAVIGPGKKWEHLELNKNGKPQRVSMHVLKGDTVKVIAGGDKGKVGTVLEVNTKRGEVLVAEVNIKTKHVKPAQQGEQGQIVKKEFPVHHSNVAVYSTTQQVASRVGYKVVDGTKRRFLKKTGELLPLSEKKLDKEA
ncbi:hypothetical protein D9Q98_002636 [Chlorella vulgaris]|uniref:KOW domain-containing protein n=1 Tax=Chlorella vulgaris TaxID=3077 RepID=A0A9D4TU74_CHLVU|nr:hypothetical protein D9Q98_002636 [Chlorella vulgaris]